MKRSCFIALVMGVAVAGTASAQPPPSDKPPEPPNGESHAELAKKVQNPVSNLISVPFQNNTDFGIGPDNRVRNVLNIQPVIPVPLGSSVLMITRTIVPIVSQPNPDDSRSAGLGDINPTFFFAPAKQSELIYGVGPAFLLPTATSSEIGTRKWSVGPSAVVVWQPKPWTIGVLASNVWSVAGSDARPDVNQLSLQYFLNYNLPNGWYLTSSPILTANWKASRGQQWTVPFGGGIGKIFRVGEAPLNGSLAAFYNAIRPDDGPSWQLRAQLALLFPR